MSCDVGEVTERLENDLILQLFFRFSCVIGSSLTSLGEPPMSRAHSPTFPSLTYVTTHSPTVPLLYVRHSSFSKPSVASCTSLLILQPFRCFTYVTAHSPNLPLLYLRHNSFSKPSVVSRTSLLILQPFRCFTYVTVHSTTLLSLLLRHKLFT